MRRVKCKSGIEGWEAKLQENYSSFSEFESYAEMRGLHTRLGYATPEEAWEANPLVQGSVNPTDFRKVEDKSHLTAISRKSLPNPTKWLILDNRIPFAPKRVLDYGCGKSHDLNNTFFHADGYDPYYRPERPTGQYDMVMCNYVLCVIPTAAERKLVLAQIQNLLKKHGVAYISVRNDKPHQGHGWTSRGTYQADVRLNLPVIHKCRDFRMYQLTKQDRLDEAL